MKIKIPCPYCKATGTKKNKGEMVFAGICSAGLFPLLDFIMPQTGNGLFDEDCKSCDGKGHLTVIKED